MTDYPAPTPAQAAPRGSAPLAGRPRPTPVRWTLPGFCSSMRVTTSFGELPLHALRKRDPLRGRAGDFAAVNWVDQIRLDEEFLSANPDAMPILIPAGSLGRDMPKIDLLVSPHQPILVSVAGDLTARLARDLEARPGIVRKPVLSITYSLFHCGAPRTVMIEGALARVSP